MESGKFLLFLTILVFILNSYQTPPHTFSRCNNGGSSNVLPIELDGFSAGLNSITFGNSNLDSANHPLIEWISIVTD